MQRSIMFTNMEGGTVRCVFVVFMLLLHALVIQSCGVSTHIEIAHRAAQYFEEISGGINYKQDQGVKKNVPHVVRKEILKKLLLSDKPGVIICAIYAPSVLDLELILENQDAFQAGNPYPDAYYDSICQGGKYHEVSEDTHWAPFMNATINYIRQNYPKPWDKATEKLVAFMLGFVSHQVADVSWHSLGIDQGFLDTMGKVNFYGSFDDAHSVGDPGGDTVAQFELDVSYIGFVSEWYIPVNDLLAIYASYYGNPNQMPKGVIEECTAILFLARLGEKLAMAKAFAYFGSESPFMVEDFQSYFLGGVDDMATWTTNVWRDAIYMLDNGTSACDIPHSPLFIDCTKNKTMNRKVNPQKHTKMKGLHTRLSYLQDLSISDVNMTWTDRGVYFAPAQHLKDQLAQVHEAKKQNKSSNMKRNPDLKLANKNAKLRTVYTSTNSYAKTGWSMITSDMNHDGIADLVLGAPGYGRTNQAQNGRVYIIYGNKDGIPSDISEKADLDKLANVALDGIQLNGRFGMAVTALDLNKDGYTDLVVSAPSVGSPQLNYTGEVYVFLSTSDGQFITEPNVTIQCQIHYCNLGRSLASGVDVNMDGYNDLVIGSPYASTTGKQRGMVNVIYASEKWTGVHKVTEIAADATLHGDQDYGWFGYTVYTSSVNFFGSFITVTQPTYRICAQSDCAYSKNDTQSVGRVSLFNIKDLTSPKLVITGESQFAKVGSMVAVGDPYRSGHSILAIGSDTEAVRGAIFQVGTNFPQAGQVKIYNLTQEFQKPAGSVPETIAVFEGDRKLGRFGQMVGIFDVNGDKIDDLFIGAPLRINDITEELQRGEEGASYVYYGSEIFPYGNVTRNCGVLHAAVEPCPDVTASVVASPAEGGARFGQNIVVWTQGQTNYLVVSAHNSNTGSRLSGALYIYTTAGPT